MTDVIVKIIADGLVFLIAIIGATTYLLQVNKDRYQTYARTLMAGLSAYAIGRIFSLYYTQTDRPFVLLGLDPKASYLDNPGFPSDHALFVITIALIVWAVTGRKLISSILAVLCLLVAVGRVLALVHAEADVVGGAVAALLGVAIWYGRDIIRPKNSRN